MIHLRLLRKFPVVEQKQTTVTAVCITALPGHRSTQCGSPSQCPGPPLELRTEGVGVGVILKSECCLGSQEMDSVTRA